MKEVAQSIYIDTNIIRGSGERFTKLLVAAKKELLKVYISEVVLWERSKQEDELHQKSLFPRQNFGVFFDSIYFKRVLEDCKVVIIEHNDSTIAEAKVLLENSENNFKLNDYNDVRDGHIIAAAKTSLSTDVFIVSNETILLERVKDLAGFKNSTKIEDLLVQLSVSNKDVKEHQEQKPGVESIEIRDDAQPYSDSFFSILPTIDPENYQKYLSSKESYNPSNFKGSGAHIPKEEPENTGQKEHVIDIVEIEKMVNTDTQIRKKVLGYLSWFSDPPISKQDLYKFLESDQFNIRLIENNAQRLEIDDLLKETENYWLINKNNTQAKKAFEQARALVMPEILEIMEQS
jgi:hypothetical protein